MAIKIYSSGGDTILNDGTDIVVSQFSYYTYGNTISLVNNNSKQQAWNVLFSDIQDEGGNQAGATLAETINYLASQVDGAIPLEIVFVNSLFDLPTASGGVITLADNVTYFFTTNLDLNGNRLVGGSNTTLIGGSSENCTLTSTGLGVGVPLFTTEYTTPIRHISFKDIDTALSIDGNSRTVALDWTGVNFVNVPNVGTINTCDNWIFTKGAFLNSKGLTFTGTVGTIGINSSIFVGDGSAGSLIELDASCVVTRRFRTIYSAVVAFGSTVAIDVNASATIPTEGFILDTVNFSGGGTYLGGIDNTSNKSLFIRCVGVVNTSVNGQMYMQDNATATTITDTTSFVKVAGTTIASADNEKYTHSDNRLTNNATIERKYLIQCTLSFNAGNNNVCEFGFYDSKLGAIRTPSRTKATANSAGRAESVTFNCVVQHSDTNYIEIHAKNTSAITDITVTDMNVVITEFI